jgi:hypothetical protein
MVAAPGKPSDIIRTWATMAAYYGLDGIIDVMFTRMDRA